MNIATRQLAGYAVLLFGALLVQLAAGPGINSDDVMYSQVWTADNGLSDVAAWLANRFEVWSSRSLIDAITIAIVDYTTLWMILNAAVLAALSLAASALASEQGDVSLQRAAIVMGCLWLAPAELVFYSMWWVTGSMNYLWPVAGALVYWAVARYRYLHGGPTGWLMAAAVAALFYASFSEQVAMTNLIVQLALIAGLRQRYWGNTLLPVGLAITLAGLALYFVAPGNASRMAGSVALYFQQFPELSTAFKAYLGLSLGVYQFFYIGSWVSAIFCVVLFLRTDGWPRAISLVALVAVLVFSGYMVGYISSPYSDMRENVAAIEGFYPATLDRVRSGEYLAAVIVGVVMAAALALALAGSLKWREANWRWPLLFVLSFIPSCMLGFSPTVYASGPRIFFISVALTVLLVAMLVRPGRHCWSFLAASGVIACFTYI